MFECQKWIELFLHKAAKQYWKEFPFFKCKDLFTSSETVMNNYIIFENYNTSRSESLQYCKKQVSSKALAKKKKVSSKGYRIRRPQQMS